MQRNRCSWVVLVMASSVADEVDNREDDDPDHIDEVPVQAGDLAGHRLLRPEPSLRREPGHRQQVEHADGDVGTVEAGEHEEGATEEVAAQRQSLVVEVLELVDLEAEEDRAGQRRHAEPEHRLVAIVPLHPGRQPGRRSTMKSDEEQHRGA